MWEFRLVTVADVTCAVQALPDKQCPSDPVSTHVRKSSTDMLAPFLEFDGPSKRDCSRRRVAGPKTRMKPSSYDVQPIAASRLGSDCIQGSLHHTAIEETRPHPGRLTVISTDLQFVGSLEAARTTCRSAASGLSQRVEAASRPAVCVPSPPFHGDSGC